MERRSTRQVFKVTSKPPSYESESFIEIPISKAKSKENTKPELEASFTRIPKLQKDKVISIRTISKTKLCLLIGIPVVFVFVVFAAVLWLFPSKIGEDATQWIREKSQNSVIERVSNAIKEKVAEIPDEKIDGVSKIKMQVEEPKVAQESTKVVTKVDAPKSKEGKTDNDNIEPIVFVPKVLETFYHDSNSFTQGLVISKSIVTESTGLYGQSSLRRYKLGAKKADVIYRLEKEFFGEGLTIFNGIVFQLTWNERVLFKYNSSTYNLIAEVKNFPYIGWGLTHNGNLLLLTDGSDKVYMLDPVTLKLIKTIQVKSWSNKSNKWESVQHLNELEFIHGHIYANIWLTDLIAIIDMEGTVVAWLNCASLKPVSIRGNRDAVLNGIALDETYQKLYITGKNWPVLYEIDSSHMNAL